MPRKSVTSAEVRVRTRILLCERSLSMGQVNT